MKQNYHGIERRKNDSRREQRKNEMKATHKKKEIMTTEQNEERKKLKDRRKQEGKYIWKKHH